MGRLAGRFVPALLALLVMPATAGLAGCDRSTPAASALTPDWREVTVPHPDGRIQIGDIAACEGHWYVAGAVLPVGASASLPVHRAGEPGGFADPGRPAIWSSMDGHTWTELQTRAISPYGPFNRFYSVACGAGHLATIGAVAGGAHGNQRISTWVGDVTGSPLTEVDASLDLYGGPDAIGVNQVSGGPHGFLIAGNRMAPGGRAGAAVWTSADGAAFTLLDNDPALRSAGDVQTTAAAGTAVIDGWLLTGNLLRAGSAGAARDPAAWSSPDGSHWTREEVPATAGDDAMEMIIGLPPAGQPDPAGGAAGHLPAGALAVGVRGEHFGAWLRSDQTAPQGSGAPQGSHWRTGGEFDTIGGSGLPMATAIAATPRSVFVAVCNGDEYHLWATADGERWRDVRVPARMSAGTQRRLLVAASGDRLLLAADDGTQARIWVATSPAG